MSYFNKVYPTDYDVQVSNDKENWVTVKTIKKRKQRYTKSGRYCKRRTYTTDSSQICKNSL